MAVVAFVNVQLWMIQNLFNVAKQTSSLKVEFVMQAMHGGTFLFDVTGVLCRSSDSYLLCQSIRELQ